MQGFLFLEVHNLSALLFLGVSAFLHKTLLSFFKSMLSHEPLRGRSTRRRCGEFSGIDIYE